MPHEVGDIYNPQSVWGPNVLPCGTKEERLALAGSLNYWLLEMETQKWPQSLRHFTNVAHLLGNQYSSFQFNEATGVVAGSEASASAVMPGGATTKIPRTVDNHLMRAYEQSVSMLTEIRPQPRISPRSASPEDEDAAATGEILVDLKWESIGMPRKMRAAASDMVCFGTSFPEITWGDTSVPAFHPVLEMVEEKNKLSGEVERYEVESKTEVEFGFEQDLRCDIFNSFHYSADPGATDDPDTMIWCYRHTYADSGWIFERYGEREEKDGYYLKDPHKLGEDAAVTNMAVYWWERIKDLIESPDGGVSFSGRASSTGLGNAPGQMLVRVWDCKPCKWYPKGRTIVQAGQEIVYCTPPDAPSRTWHEDYAHRWHPYAPCRYWTVPGRFQGVSLLSQLLPLQKSINAIESLIQLARELGTIGQWLIPSQCNVAEGATSGLPGADMKYRANSQGAKPEKVKHQPLPAEYWQEKADKTNRISVIASTESALASSAPSAVRSGPMLDFYKREIMKSKSPTFQGFGESLETIGQNMLIESAIHLKKDDPDLTAQMMQIARERSHLAIQTFTGASLRHNYNVRYDVAQEALRSPEAKEQKAIEVAQFLGPTMTPTDQAKILKIIGLDEFDTETSSDLRRARRMISMIASGNEEWARPEQDVDNPEVFLEVFRREIQSDRMLTYEKPAQDKIRTLHAIYKSLQQAAQLAQLQQMLMISQIEGGGRKSQSSASSAQSKGSNSSGASESRAAA